MLKSKKKFVSPFSCELVVIGSVLIQVEHIDWLFPLDANMQKSPWMYIMKLNGRVSRDDLID